MRPIPVVFAQTHPPEYLLHKYWSRKPHNVLALFLSELLPRPGTVVDPFCGSGVLLREAARLGFSRAIVPAAPLVVPGGDTPSAERGHLELLRVSTLKEALAVAFSTETGTSG